MADSPAILLLGAHRWGRQPVIELVTHAGYKAIVLVRECEQIEEEEMVNTHASEVWRIPAQPNGDDLRDIAERAKEAFGDHWHVVPLDDYCGELGGALSQYAPVSCFPAEAAKSTFEKHLLRALWDKICDEHPELPLVKTLYAYLEYTSHESYENTTIFQSEEMESTDGSFIIKPNAYAGSIGILQALSKKDLRDKIPQARQMLAAEMDQPTMKGIPINPDMIIEKVIPRKFGLGFYAEFTCHVISLKGKHQIIGLSEKVLNTQTFIETGHVFPSPHFPQQFLPHLQETIQLLLDELKVQNTLSNWEFIIAPDDRLALVEGHLRPSGDTLMELITLSTGHNPYEVFLKGLAGEDLPDWSPQQTAATFWPGPYKALEKITDIDMSEVNNGIAVQIDREELQSSYFWQGPLSWYDRLITITCVAPESRSAIRQCSETAEKIVLKGKDNKGQMQQTFLHLNGLRSIEI